MKTSRTDLKIGLTIAAAAIGVSADTLARYENGIGEPSYRQMISFAQLVGQDLDWFAE